MAGMANASSSELALGQSWTGGFVVDGVGIDDEVAALAQSWTGLAFGESQRRDSTNPPNFYPTKLAPSDGEAQKRSSVYGPSDTGLNPGIHDAARIMDWTKVRDLSIRNPEAAAFFSSELPAYSSAEAPKATL